MRGPFRGRDGRSRCRQCNLCREGRSARRRDVPDGPVVGVRVAAQAPVRHEANGLWGIARHADVFAVERAPQLWSNAGGYRPQPPSAPSM